MHRIAQLTRRVDATKSLDISYPVSQFRSYITDSDLYDDKVMSVKVVHTRKSVYHPLMLVAITNLSALHFPMMSLLKERPDQRSLAKTRRRRTRKVLSATSPIQALTCVTHAPLNPLDAHPRPESNHTPLC